LPAPLHRAREHGYYRHVVFDNSLPADNLLLQRRFGRTAQLSGAENWRLPVETKTFLTPRNASGWSGSSQPGGGWEAEVRSSTFSIAFRNFPDTICTSVCFARKRFGKDLPSLVLSNTAKATEAEIPGAFSEPLPMGKFAGDFPSGAG